MTWDAKEQEGKPVMLAKADAIAAIKKMAVEQGYNKFRVSYDGVETEASELPQEVDMSLVRISAMLNNA